LISAQGTHIVSKLRPVDHLRQLLIENHGPDNDIVKSFFTLHSEVQAACACLVLACSQSVQDNQVAEWATRALFLHGGEPRLVFPAQQQQQQRPPVQGILSPGSSAFSPSSFHPNIASTPAPQGHHNPFTPARPNDTTHLMYGGPAGNQSMYGAGPVIPEMHFSSKHNALYLYLSRLVRPVWLRTVVMMASREDPVSSSVSSDELGWIMAQLLDLKNFFEKQAQMLINPGSESQYQQQQQQQQPLQDAYLRERQSLLFLQQLLSQTLQVLGLWRVVCDHQCHAVVGMLSTDEQNLIKGIYFRDLILSLPGRELCGRLIQVILIQ
jgi:nuclear pore complex protein Nup155